MRITTEKINANAIGFNISVPALSKAKLNKESNLEIYFTYSGSRYISAFLRHAA
jgi:hypothetical protein